MTKINIIIDYEIISLKCLFFGIDCIRSIKFKKCNRNDITNMSYMFYNCFSLKKLDISEIKTDNVTNMSFMFYLCKLFLNDNLILLKLYYNLALFHQNHNNQLNIDKL